NNYYYFFNYLYFISDIFLDIGALWRIYALYIIVYCCVTYFYRWYCCWNIKQKYNEPLLCSSINDLHYNCNDSFCNNSYWMIIFYLISCDESFSLIFICSYCFNITRVVFKNPRTIPLFYAWYRGLVSLFCRINGYVYFLSYITSFATINRNLYDSTSRR